MAKRPTVLRLIDNIIDSIDSNHQSNVANNLKQRQLGAIFGALVADAGSRPLHWVYKDDAMDKAIKDKADFTFLAQNVCPFYSLPTGRSSCYGDQLYATLRSLSACQGLDIKHWKQTLYDTFGGEQNIYQTSRKLRDNVKSILHFLPYFHDLTLILITLDSCRWTMASCSNDRFL